MPTVFRASLALFVLVVILGSCRKVPVPPIVSGPCDEGVVHLRFVPEWEGEPFLPFVERQNVSGYRVQVELVRFYLSDIRLVQGSNSTDMAQVIIVDFNDGPVERSFSTKAGSWSALEMGLGVTEELNHSDPVLYANDHPLSASNGMHWDWAMGYIFTKFEGRHDLLSGSTGPFPNTFSIHTGFDTAYVDIDLIPTQPVLVQANHTTTVTIRVAIDRFFQTDEGGTIDLENEYMSHGTNVPLSLKLSRNVANSFTID